MSRLLEIMSLMSLTLIALAMVVGSAHGDMKPTKFAKEVVCEGCHAVISEANRILGKGKRTDRTIGNALSAACDTQRLNRYEFSPPTMNKVCKYWTENYEDEIKTALTGGLPEDEQEIELCFTTTDICVGVDRSKFRINKYEGPSKRKILAAKKAARGETADEEEITDEIEAEAAAKPTEDTKKAKKENTKKDSKKEGKVEKAEDKKTKKDSKKEGKGEKAAAEDKKTKKDSKKKGKVEKDEEKKTGEATQAAEKIAKKEKVSTQKSKSKPNEEQKDEL